MHPDLSPHLHTPECNKLIVALHECHQENKLSKFLGKCNELDKEVIKCLRRERANNQAINRQKALERQQQIKEQMKHLESSKAQNNTSTQ